MKESGAWSRRSLDSVARWHAIGSGVEHGPDTSACEWVVCFSASECISLLLCVYVRQLQVERQGVHSPRRSSIRPRCCCRSPSVSCGPQPATRGVLRRRALPDACTSVPCPAGSYCYSPNVTAGQDQRRRSELKGKPLITPTCPPHRARRRRRHPPVLPSPTVLLASHVPRSSTPFVVLRGRR